MPRIIHVTQQDIDGAIAGDSRHCAVADAILRTMDGTGVSRVLVDIQSIRYSLPSSDARYIFLTPQEVQQHIIDFDAGKELKPFTFRLGKPAYTGARQHTRGGEHGKIDYTTVIGVRTEREDGNGVKNKDVRVRSGPPKQSPYARVYGVRRMRINQG